MRSNTIFESASNSLVSEVRSDAPNCERLEQYGVYAITLHDGVYIRNCDKEMLDSIGVNIETIFWQELNLFIDQPQLQQAA